MFCFINYNFASLVKMISLHGIVVALDVKILKDSRVLYGLPLAQEGM